MTRPFRPTRHISRIWVPFRGDSSLAHSLAFFSRSLQPDWLLNSELKILTSDLNPANDTSIKDSANPKMIDWLINQSIIAPTHTPASQKSAHANQLELTNRTFLHNHHPLNSYPYHNIDLIICNFDLNNLTATTRSSLLEHFKLSLKPFGLLWYLPTNDKFDFGGFFQLQNCPPGLFEKIHHKHSAIAFNKESIIDSKRSTYVPNIQNIMANHSLLDARLKHHCALNQLIETIAFPTILINDKGTIYHTLGDTNHFLTRLPTGAFSDNIRDHLVDPLQAIFLPSLEKSISTGENSTIIIPHIIADRIVEELFRNTAMNSSVESVPILKEVEFYHLRNMDLEYHFIAVIFKTNERRENSRVRNLIDKNEKQTDNTNEYYLEKIKKLEASVTTLSLNNAELRLSNDNLELINRTLSSKYESLVIKNRLL